MALVADGQREQTVAALRRYYVEGRLDALELSHRVENALRARTTDDLRAALRDLPWVADTARGVARTSIAAAWVAGLAVLWVIGSAVLLSVFVVALVSNASGETLLGVALAWLLLSGAVGLHGRRRLARR
ncbi:MAG: hypothetical protein QOE36_2075 [Gaiellaceae bacterium]|jgi:hypothetical protein|nr:hypothetical protein [Gaiellaceae bacterium]